MIDFGQFPQEMQEGVRKEIEQYGEWITSCSIYMAPLWKMIDALQETDTDVVWLATALHMVNFFNSHDPLPVHFVVAREKLKDKKEENDQSVDVLARELVSYCREFQGYIANVFSVKENSLIPLPMYQEGGFLIPGRNYLPDFICERDRCNSFDLCFCDFIETIGDTGREAAKAIRKDSKHRHQIFRDSGYKAEYRPKAWNLWVNKKDGRTTVFSPFISILTEIIWEDRVRKKFEKRRAYQPAIASSFWSQTMKPTLKKNCRIETSVDRVAAISDEGRVIASIKTVPCIDENSLSLIRRGLKSLGSLSGHRLLRWEIKSGCQNIINEVPDPRLLVTDGGYEGIAKLIGCGNNKTQVTEVKSILHAQAHCQFQFPNGDKVSSLIMLREIGFHRNKEPNKIKIILGDILFPNALFQLPKGAQQLLIPVADLPHLIGSPNTHAAQAMLQLLILDEFSQQSRRLVEKGSVYIPIEKWQLLAREASLPLSILPRVIEGWTTNDPIAFLQKDGDEYTFAKAHEDILVFLEDQGNRRIQGSVAGKKSAQLAAAKKQRILSRQKVKGT